MKQYGIMDKIQLENGETIYIEDLSRPVAGERWQVRLAIRIPVEPRPEHFGGLPDPEAACREVIDHTGGVAEFRVERVRNFVSEEKIAQVISEMRDEFLKSNIGYIGKSHFAAAFLKRKYEEILREKELRKAWESAGRQG